MLDSEMESYLLHLIRTEGSFQSLSRAGVLNKFNINALFIISNL
jgi:hypothetical protein